MTKEDRKVMLENVARQAYLEGLSDAPRIMGRRGREKQLLPPSRMQNYVLTQIEWADVKARITRQVEWSFENEPNEEM